MAQQERLELVANISVLFAEFPYLQRFERAAAAGFAAVETWWPWDAPTPSTAEVDEFVAALRAAGVRLAALNFHSGDMSAGERGIVSLPDRGGSSTPTSTPSPRSRNAPASRGSTRSTASGCRTSMRLCRTGSPPSA